MNIVIDIGNTRTKAGVFKSGQLLQQYAGHVSDVLEALSVHAADHVIVSAVGKGLEEVKAFYASRMPMVVFDRSLNIPLQMDYATPETLGLDRLAAALGATVFFPDKDMLVIDMGSCITIDVVEKGKTFCGGVISPGLTMRFKAMHMFTEKLPLIDLTSLGEDTVLLPGKSTKACMTAGVMKAVEFELAGHINHYRSRYPDLVAIITGGDASYFENKFNTPIFTKDSLVLVGLNRVLEYHVA